MVLLFDFKFSHENRLKQWKSFLILGKRDFFFRRKLFDNSHLWAHQRQTFYYGSTQNGTQSKPLFFTNIAIVVVGSNNRKWLWTHETNCLPYNITFLIARFEGKFSRIKVNHFLMFFFVVVAEANINQSSQRCNLSDFNLNSWDLVLEAARFSFNGWTTVYESHN